MPDNKNLELASWLESVQRTYRDLFNKGLMDSEFQSVAFSHAAKIIAEFNEPITSVSQLDGIRGFGPVIKGTIKDWLKTGKISLVSELKQRYGFRARSPRSPRTPKFKGNRVRSPRTPRYNRKPKRIKTPYPIRKNTNKKKKYRSPKSNRSTRRKYRYN